MYDGIHACMMEVGKEFLSSADLSHRLVVLTFAKNLAQYPSIGVILSLTQLHFWPGIGCFAYKILNTKSILYGFI